MIETVGKDYILTANVYDVIKADVEYAQAHVVRYIKEKEMMLEYLQGNTFIKNE